MLLCEIASPRKKKSQIQQPNIVQQPNPDLDPNKAKARLLGRIDFTSTPEETDVIMQRLKNRGIEPTLSNVQHYLVQCLTIPFDELPREEKMIILRSGREERFK